MRTPICDFVKAYAEGSSSRFHMPGHKGASFLGCEKLDITEIDGADVLYSADGIINESEEIATSLFSSLHSFYSTEGSTLCIKAMLTLICKHAESRPLILAARNVHKAFIYAAALLDFDIQWMHSDKSSHLCSCILTKQDVENYILNSERKPSAVYLTSPDYLGNIADIKGIAEICDKHGIPLIVDNAHGAYLKFLKEDIHPITLGATMCCDSAHKTLPVLTGGAYLHLSHKAKKYLPDARDALSLHASTSPSYLIMQSLDLCNRYISDSFTKKLTATSEKMSDICQRINALGISATLTEPLKAVIYPRSFGYTGNELAELMKEKKIVCEFSDRDSIVLMATAENSEEDFEKLLCFFSSLNKLPEKKASPSFCLKATESKASVRQAMLSASEYVASENAVGRICAEPSVSCPPAVPICISGEVITKEIAKAFIHFDIKQIKVLK